MVVRRAPTVGIVKGGASVRGSWDGASYAGIAALQRELARESIAALSFSGDERVLDVGCGDGSVTAAIAEWVGQGRVLGVDLSPGQIAFARDNFGRPGLCFQVADADSLSAWANHLDSLGIANSGVYAMEGTPFRLLTFTDPDNIQLELIAFAG